MRKQSKSKQKADRFERMLEKMKDLLPSDLQREVSVAINSDGSVDGQLRIRGIGRRDDIMSILTDLEAATSKISKSWISVGYRFPEDHKVKSENYERWRGLLQTQLYHQLLSGAKRKGKKKIHNIPIHYRTARKVYQRMRGKGRRKPTEIFIRLHFNPQGQKPGPRLGKKR
jgi:hypothetical protein